MSALTRRNCPFADICHEMWVVSLLRSVSLGRGRGRGNTVMKGEDGRAPTVGAFLSTRIKEQPPKLQIEGAMSRSMCAGSHTPPYMHPRVPPACRRAPDDFPEDMTLRQLLYPGPKTIGSHQLVELVASCSTKYRCRANTGHKLPTIFLRPPDCGAQSRRQNAHAATADHQATSHLPFVACAWSGLVYATVMSSSSKLHLQP